MVRTSRLLDYNLLFRSFVGLSMDDAIRDPTVFTKDRDRLLRGEIAQLFFDQVLAPVRDRSLSSDEPARQPRAPTRSGTSRFK
jgi:transposase